MPAPADTPLVAVVLGAVSVPLWADSLWILFRQQRELWRFESTTGGIVTADVGPAPPPWYRRLLAGGQGDSSSESVSGRAQTDHQHGDVPVVEYESVVAGETYTSDTI